MKSSTMRPIKLAWCNMPQIQRSALVPYSAMQMYNLVNDVARYPEFLPWCAGSEVLEVSPELMVARLDLVKGLVKQSFTTRNILRVGEQIELNLQDGPFSRLQGLWQFSPLADDACKINMQLEFELTSKIASFALGKVFHEAVNQLVDAFCQRANKVY